jgi:hypothetical protein
MTWLWAIFAGFYLVAYVFWVPHLFSNVSVVVSVGTATLVVGLSLLADGFRRALQLQGPTRLRSVPFERARRTVGGLMLLAYLLVYLPPQGRVVAHWPLDLAITAVSGGMMVVYGLMNY